MTSRMMIALSAIVGGIIVIAVIAATISAATAEPPVRVASGSLYVLGDSSKLHLKMDGSFDASSAANTTFRGGSVLVVTLANAGEKSVNINSKQIRVEDADGSRYTVRNAWIIDSRALQAQEVNEAAVASDTAQSTASSAAITSLATQEEDEPDESTTSFRDVSVSALKLGSGKQATIVVEVKSGLTTAGRLHIVAKKGAALSIALENVSVVDRRKEDNSSLALLDRVNGTLKPLPSDDLAALPQSALLPELKLLPESILVQADEVPEANCEMPGCDTTFNLDWVSTASLDSVATNVRSDWLPAFKALGFSEVVGSDIDSYVSEDERERLGGPRSVWIAMVRTRVVATSELTDRILIVARDISLQDGEDWSLPLQQDTLEGLDDVGLPLWMMPYRNIEAQVYIDG